jgi:hypothetical protein
MPETTFSVLKEISGLPLGEVFQYILSLEWGIEPDPQANRCTEAADRYENKENDQNKPD